MATPSLTPQLIRAIFTEADTLEFGLRLPIEAVYHDRAKNMISTSMKGNPALREKIMVCAFPKDDELWFIKRTVEIEV